MAFSSVIADYSCSGCTSPLVLPLVVVVGLSSACLNALGVNKLNLELFISTLVSMSVFQVLAYTVRRQTGVHLQPLFHQHGQYEDWRSGHTSLIMIVAFIVFGIILPAPGW